MEILREPRRMSFALPPAGRQALQTNLGFVVKVRSVRDVLGTGQVIYHAADSNVLMIQSEERCGGSSSPMLTNLGEPYSLRSCQFGTRPQQSPCLIPRPRKVPSIRRIHCGCCRGSGDGFRLELHERNRAQLLVFALR
jgi:hypothetical protein